jgi:ribonuclease HI
MFTMCLPRAFPGAGARETWAPTAGLACWHCPPSAAADLAASFPAAAPLRWAGVMAMYTDGAAVKTAGGGTTLGAAVYDARADRTYLVDPCGRGSTNTITRAELGAIDQALAHAPVADTVLVCTDSACSIALAKRMAFLPSTLHECKHLSLLRSVVASLLHRARAGLRTHICKVVAHVGVHGNECADKGADAVVKGAPCHWSVTADNESTLDLPAWLVMADPPAAASGEPALNKHTGNPFVLSNLTSAVAANTDMGLHAPGAARRTYYTNLRDRLATISDPSASNAMWTSRPYSVCRMVLQVRYGTLNCPALAARQRRPYVAGSRVMGAACPLCRHAPCTPGHILGGCTHPMLKSMYISRHNGAVCMLQRAVSEGDKGSSLLCVLMDAGQRADLPEGVLGSRVPPWLLPDSCLSDGQSASPGGSDATPELPEVQRLKLRPDLLFISGLPPSAVPRDPTRVVPARRRMAATVYVVEVGYVSDSSAALAGMLERKRAQHAALCACLARAGWRVHTGGPLVLPLGSTGTVYNAWRDAALLLGVPAAAVPPLMRALHLHSVDTAASINRTRLHLERTSGGAHG